MEKIYYQLDGKHQRLVYFPPALVGTSDPGLVLRGPAAKWLLRSEAPDSCPKCGSGACSQDEDTLDTWFSSALWPFSTLGWPEDTEDLQYFYPTNTLVTGYDIIFFWVARMIFSGIEQMGEVPFNTVFIPRPGSRRTGQKNVQIAWKRN